MECPSDHIFSLVVKEDSLASVGLPKLLKTWSWWFIPTIPVLGKLKKVSLGYYTYLLLTLA